MRARARPVGDVDRIGEVGERQRLREKVVGVARDRRRDLGGDDEPSRAQQLFQARSRLLRGCIHLLSGLACAIAAGAAQYAGEGRRLYSRSAAQR
jgi:hypothetical protein